MGEFFKGPLRKIGGLTFLMACLFSGGWVRSLFCYDSIRLNFQSSVYAISSGWGELHFVTGTYAGGLPIVLMSSRDIPPKQDVFAWDRVKTLWQWEWAGFQCRDVLFFHERYRFCFVPYWPVAIPLTLISLWLLLLKPRQSNPVKSVSQVRT